MNPKAQSLGRLTDGHEAVRMLCEIDVEEAPGAQTPDSGKPPEWIHIMPAGPAVEARDGRAFQISDALAVAARTETPLVIDWDHESEWGKTRAAGWIEELKVQLDDAGEFPRAGMWGRATWTVEGKADVAARAYRFLSPVVILDSETRDAQQVVSVALTNRPALRMHGLDAFREQLSRQLGERFAQQHPRGADSMDKQQVAALCSALGIAPDADHTAIVESARNAATTREAHALLKSELAEERTRRIAAEGKLAEQSAAEFSARVDRVLDAAAKDGKVTPASANKWRAFCMKSADNLAMFEADILPDLRAVGEPAKPPSSEAKAAEKRTVAAGYSRYGITAEEAKAAEQYNATRRASAEETEA